MVKKKTTAPPATEKPKSEPVEAPKETEGGAVVPEAVSPIQIPKEVLEQAKAFGIDLNQIVEWARSMEEFKAVAMQNFEIIQKSFNKLEPLVKISEQVTQAQNTPQPTATGQPNTLAGMLQLLPQLLAGGGGGDNEFAELGKKALLSQINMSTAITNAVVSKITGKATTEVAEAITGG